MADSAKKVLAGAGHAADIEIRKDTDAFQPGAALALFADLPGQARFGADQAGALGRPAESIGKYVANQLLEELDSGSALDRFAADQLIPFAALAAGESRFRVHSATDHVLTNAWLAKTFLGTDMKIEDHTLSVTGVGLQPKQPS
jgi:RNA 3'-terminal phosphate cyclase